MPSLYLKSNYMNSSQKLGMGHSRQSSMERGVLSVSKEPLNRTGASFIQNNSNLGADRESRYSRGHKPGGQSIEDQSHRNKSPITSSNFSMHAKARIKTLQSRHDSKYTDNKSATCSIEKLRKTFNMNKRAKLSAEELLLDKKINNSSTKCTNEHETTVLWRDDLKIDIENELEFISCLGQGSFAKVYEGIDKRNKMSVAVKVIDKRKITEPKRQALIQTEITLMSRLKHKNIGEFYRLIEDHKRIFIVMQLCGTLTLNQFCKQFQGRKLNEEQAFAIFSQIVKGVKFMHERGIAHRDLKLTNILIDSEYSVKVIDFGFACEAADRQKMYCGTPSYMAPEIVEKRLYYSKPTDIWSLGVILYKLLTAEYVFGGKFRLI